MKKKKNVFQIAVLFALQMVSKSVFFLLYLLQMRHYYRFKSKLVRRLASGTFIARNVFIMGITMYTPCVALNTVANIPYWASYLLMTALGILFTIFVSEKFR